MSEAPENGPRMPPDSAPRSRKQRAIVFPPRSGPGFKARLDRLGLDTRTLACLTGTPEHLLFKICMGLEEAPPAVMGVISLWGGTSLSGRHMVRKIMALEDDPRGFAGEVWRPISGTSKYEVSDKGRVRRTALGAGAMPGHVLKATATPHGHRHVTVYYDDGRQRRTSVHRLVAEAFLGPPPEPSMIVLHNDGNPQNNEPWNLRWGTYLENSDDTKRHREEKLLREGLADAIRDRLGSEKYRRRLAREAAKRSSPQSPSPSLPD